MPQSFSPPLAFNFFNPATDLQRVESPVPPSTTPEVRTGQGSENSVRMTRPLCRSDSLSRRGSFLSLPSSGSLQSPPLFQTNFGATNLREPPPLARAPGEHRHYAGAYAKRGVVASRSRRLIQQVLVLSLPMISSGNCEEDETPKRI